MKYAPNDRFMITVTKSAELSGIQLVDYKGSLYIGDVDEGPFYATAIDRGDKILSINGIKSEDIANVAHAENILLESKEKITLFLERPDPNEDPGCRYIMERIF